MILKAASQGATGGFSDINTVGNAATSVLNAYGKSAKDAGFLVDQFIQTQNDGKIIVAEYAANIGKVASVAATMNVPLKEVNAAIAQVTAAGVKSEVAFTGMKTALLRLTGEAGGKKLAKLGIDINASTIASEGLAANLKKLEGLNIKSLESIFGQEAIQVMAPLIKDLEKYEQLIKNQESATGAAAAAQIEASNTIQGALKRVTASFSNLFAEQSELGAAIRITLQGVSVVIDGLGIAIKTLMLPVRLLFKLFAGIGSVFEEQFGKGNSAIVLITKSWTFFLEKVQKGFQLVESVATAIGMAIGSIALAFDPLFKVIPEVINDAKTRFMKFVTDVKDVFTGLAEIIANVFRRIFKFISDGINRIWEAIPEPLKKFLKGTGEKIASVASSAAQPFQEGFSDVMGDLKGFNKDEEGNARIIDMTKFQEALAKAGGDINKAWKEYLGTVKETNNELDKQKQKTETGSVPAVNKLKEAFEAVKETIASGLHSAVMGLIDGTKSLGESLAGIAKQIASLMLKKAIFGAFGLKAAEGAYVANGIRPFNQGGLVTKPTMGLVGEAGEDEYIIPASKMAQSMQRYSSGARGESVIPGTGSSSGGTAGSASTTVNYSGPVLNFNSEEFVPKSAIGQIINSAASRGAKAGEARTLASLQNSRSKRGNIGL
jgi:TP901 family phage tail tape measure protein